MEVRETAVSPNWLEVGRRQDVHHIQARPSLIAAVRRADLLVCTGAERRWPAIQEARNGSLFVLAATGAILLLAAIATGVSTSRTSWWARASGSALPSFFPWPW
jgi:hypothetical protein